ncbi:hypothetical protein EDC61_11096 [Sulfuritortus calidifontis]|uniref:Membrane-bound lysozyme inhibitor of c-type lysozyme MliC n=1 Tax=Sulfuritortus calidifontis TaxID=1914471 RepID=A0A4R3JWL5_9PROT|nr:hypothetical protein [Sulfuritortus calidifontis]TCS71369.1 hypothetical protein EDC61_11096 [Sulfuritortus calidifontis]
MSTLKILATAVATTLLIAGCATSGGKSAAEATPGKFVTYSCEGNKSFSVRFDAENGTARIRTHDGSAELSKGARGLYRDDAGEWILTLADGKGTELVHKSKAVYKSCSAQ